MKIVTFLGTGNYQQATYVFEDQEFRTDLFPEALATLRQPDEMLVFLTQEARSKHWTTLQERLAGKVPLHPIDIPSGKSEEELWQIFQALAGSLHKGEEVTFDVTHAFRSLPILALLATAYLRVVNQVRLAAILYGAYEAKDAAGRAPVFNLTPFVDLLDWVTATDRFLRSGDATDLADLLCEAHQLPWRTAGTPAREELPRHLKKLANNLRDLTQAFLLARPAEIARHADTVNNELPKAEPEMARFAQPFVLLLERMRPHVASLAADDLRTQRCLVHRYIKHHHTVQALTLAREWLINWVCVGLNLDRRKERKDAEDALNHLGRRQRNSPIDGEPSPLVERLAALPQVKEVLHAWDSIADLRNDVAHCGFRESPRSSRSILEAVKQIADHLDRLSLPEG